MLWLLFPCGISNFVVSRQGIILHVRLKNVEGDFVVVSYKHVQRKSIIT